MHSTHVTDDGCVVVLESGISGPSGIGLVERKGAGHPDTLADHLADTLSRTYSQYTSRHFGAVLHHNFDKLALLGGAAEVRYGGGRMLAPVRALLNGRASPSCGGQRVPVDEIAVETTRAFFRQRLPEVAEHLKIELNITANASPGAVHTSATTGPDRASWFAPASVDQLRERSGPFANDTSFGTGWAPVNSVEEFARRLVDRLSTPNAFTHARPWCGSDVKIMAYADADTVDAVLCVPQKCGHVPDQRSYLANREDVLAECLAQARQSFPGLNARVQVNARDIVTRDELYLTYTGSSIESGDEGLVGRGNRINGLITPLRPMNLEGANGKNPVYHVGKIYNVAAMRTADLLHRDLGGYVEVHMISATGRRLSSPWRVVVRAEAPDVRMEEVRDRIEGVLASLSSITDELVDGDLILS